VLGAAGHSFLALAAIHLAVAVLVAAAILVLAVVSAVAAMLARAVLRMVIPMAGAVLGGMMLVLARGRGLRQSGSGGKGERRSGENDALHDACLLIESDAASRAGNTIKKLGRRRVCGGLRLGAMPQGRERRGRGDQGDLATDGKTLRLDASAGHRAIDVLAGLIGRRWLVVCRHDLTVMRSFGCGLGGHRHRMSAEHAEGRYKQRQKRQKRSRKATYVI
jgi:hypothetical protein